MATHTTTTAITLDRIGRGIFNTIMIQAKQERDLLEKHMNGMSSDDAIHHKLIHHATSRAAMISQKINF